MDGKQLRTISRKRLAAAKKLAEAGDFDGAAQMLGLSLECALKAACCKSLRLSEYPVGRKGDDGKYFKTHSFDRLLIVSGCEDIFSVNGEGFVSWSEFTSPFAGNGSWVEMRYEDGVFSNETVNDMINSLEAEGGILSILTKRKRW